MNHTFIVTLPILLVFAAALATRKVIFALLIGIISASFIASDFSINQSLSLIGMRLFEQTGLKDIIRQTGSYDKAYLFGFLILLGVLIEFLTHAGGIHAAARALLKRTKNARQTELTTLFLSLFLFIDDSLNALMIGAIIRPLSDFFKIPRIKLAYLLNSTSASLAIFIPASSWTGVIISQLETSGVQKALTAGTLINTDSFYFLLCTLPFMIYPVLSILSAWYVVQNKISFGKMREQEEYARETGNLFGGKACAYQPPETAPDNCEGSIFDIIMPIAVFVITYIVVLLSSGNYKLLGGTKDIIGAFMSANSAYASFLGAFAALLVVSTQFLMKGREVKKIGALAWSGFIIMKNALIMLLLAWTFSFLLQHDLGAGDYIAHKFLPLITIGLAPVLVFITATLMVIGIGSSWGAIALLIPVILPIIAHLAGTPPITSAGIFIITPVLGALLSGTIAGSQFSPIADSGIIASLGAQCNHSDHTQTMANYALTTLIGTTLAFTLLGFILPIFSPLWASIISLFTGLFICAGLLHLRNKLGQK